MASLASLTRRNRNAVALLMVALSLGGCAIEPLTTADLEGSQRPPLHDALSNLDTRAIADTPPTDAKVAGPKDTAVSADAGGSTCTGVGIVNGDVVSACTNVGLAAVVQFGGRRVCSLAYKASFTLPDVPAGCPLLLTAYKPGYIRYAMPARVPKNGSVIERIVLIPEGGCGAPTPPELGCDCDAGACTR